jgi:serine/threonine protein kinase
MCNVWDLVTELMPMGSLQDVLFCKGIRLSFQQRISVLKSIALGMNWLHKLKPPFLHRDLKSGNILVCGCQHVRCCAVAW